MKTRYIILASILAVTAALVNFLDYDTFYKAGTAVETIHKIPLVLGPWTGRDVPLDTRVYDILETRAIINRIYTYDGHEVFLSLVYYPETKVDFHAPEGCLAGRGVRISKSSKTIFINYDKKKVDIRVNQLIRRQGSINELYYYFYKAGSFVGDNYIKLRLNLALSKFSRNRKSGSLIRVSMPVGEGGDKEASRILTEFIQELYPYIVKYL